MNVPPTGRKQPSRATQRAGTELQQSTQRHPAGAAWPVVACCFDASVSHSVTPGSQGGRLWLLRRGSYLVKSCGV